MASTYLTRTPSSASNRRTFTISTWVKKCNTSGNKIIFSQGVDNGEFFSVRLDARGYLNVFHLTNGGYTYESILSTSMMLRDNNGWYHITVAVDTTQATASDRTKIYINGNLITDFVSGENSYPSQNFDSYVNTTNVATIGAKPANGDNLDGHLSHFHFIDGTAYAASDFGETDSTTGEWKINTSPSVTYGTNGFFILKDGNSVTDQSGNSNNFTVGGGTLTKTEDNPSNVFATGNPLYYFNGGHTFSNGNNTMYISGGWRSIISTLGTGTGKYYAEAKFVSVHSGSNNAVAGITELNGTVDEDVAQGLHGNYSTGSTYAYHNDGQLYYNSTNAGAWGSTWTAGDIIGIAVDTENNKLYFHKNGTYQASGNPTAGTGGYSIDANKIYGIGCSGYYNTMSMNYGNGYFGTTAVASAGTNASGNGIFEYDVPTGYTALSTKGLNL